MASDQILFWVFAAIAVFGSLAVVLQRNPVYGVLAIISSFFGLSGLYVLLEAPFVAVVQIIIYAGAIMVLFLFVVMLLNATREDGADWDRSHPFYRPGPTYVGGALAVLPGPLTIPPVLIGLWIWSTEFAWANRLFQSFQRKAGQAWKHAKVHPISSGLITIGGLAAAGAVFWAVGHYELVDRARELVGL